VEKEVKTIKDEEWFLKMKDKGGHNVVASQNVSSAQVYLKDLDYYQEAANNRRGAIGEINKEAIYYDVASAPPDIKYIKNAIIAIIEEKMINDVNVFNALLERMQKDGIMEDGSKITIEEVANAIINDVDLITWA